MSKQEKFIQEKLKKQKKKKQKIRRIQQQFLRRLQKEKKSAQKKEEQEELAIFTNTMKQIIAIVNWKVRSSYGFLPNLLLTPRYNAVIQTGKFPTWYYCN